LRNIINNLHRDQFNKKNTIILKRKIVNNKCIITYNKASFND
jgi:hypothetical protein